jgi:hypothetical protein
MTRPASITAVRPASTTTPDKIKRRDIDALPIPDFAGILDEVMQ